MPLRAIELPGDALKAPQIRIDARLQDRRMVRFGADALRGRIPVLRLQPRPGTVEDRNFTFKDTI